MLLKNPKNSLHLVNNLFAIISKSDPHLFKEIKHAIEFADNPRLSPSTTGLHKILSIYSQANASVGFYHWNMLDTKDLDPLWLRSYFIKILEVLKPYEHALVIVTNLNAALSPPHPRYTDSKRAMDYLQSLAATETNASQSLNLLFL